MEICMLWLLEDCIISAYNHLAQGDYNSTVAEFQNGHPVFCECFQGSGKCDRLVAQSSCPNV